MLLGENAYDLTICECQINILLQNKLNIKIMNTEKFTTVTYTLENGTKIVQPINKQAFVNEKGRLRTEAEMHKLFAETAWDKRAVSYTIDSETNESLSTDKELHFTKNERKVAKRDYREFQKSNSLGFKHSLKAFQKLFVDSLTNNRRIRMNIGNIILQ